LTAAGHGKRKNLRGRRGDGSDEHTAGPELRCYFKLSPRSARTPRSAVVRPSAAAGSVGRVSVDKREQVFVSSTYLDLKAERQEVIQTLLEANCIPAGMELFPASDDEKWTLIKRVIDDSDYYVVILGGRYGSIDPDRGISFTEMEFDYAVEVKKPIMAFLHGAPGKIPGEKLELKEEPRAKLEAFRAKCEVTHGEVLDYAERTGWPSGQEPNPDSQHSPRRWMGPR
jgi:hypothetical protein